MAGAGEAAVTGEVLGERDATGAGASWVNLIFTVGFENVKFEADIRSQPVAGSSLTIVVATLLSPFSLAIETVALMGAFVKP